MRLGCRRIRLLRLWQCRNRWFRNRRRLGLNRIGQGLGDVFESVAQGDNVRFHTRSDLLGLVDRRKAEAKEGLAYALKSATQFDSILEAKTLMKELGG